MRELRVKETDRIQELGAALGELGAAVGLGRRSRHDGPRK